MPLKESPTHPVRQAQAGALAAPLGTAAVRPEAPFALRHGECCSLFWKHLHCFSSTAIIKTPKAVLSLVLGRVLYPDPLG